MKKHFMIFLVLVISLSAVSQIYAQEEEKISLKELEDILPGWWHGQLESMCIGGPALGGDTKFSDLMAVMEITDLYIDKYWSITGWAKLKWSPQYIIHTKFEDGYYHIETNYEPWEVGTKIEGFIAEDGMMRLNVVSSIKINMIETSESYVDHPPYKSGKSWIDPPPMHIKEESTQELDVSEAFSHNFMANEDIELLLCDLVELGGEIELSFSPPPILSAIPLEESACSSLKTKFILKKIDTKMCEKRDKLSIGGIISTKYTNKTETLPNGTKITKSNDRIKIVTKDGCVEIFITEYSKIIGSDGTEIVILTRKVLDGVISSHLYRGYIQVDTWEDGKHHSFTTKNAIVEGKGDNFTLKTSEDGTTTLTVIDGEVEFSDKEKKKTVIVKKNQRSVCLQGGLPLEPVSIDSSMILRWWE